MPDTQTYAEVSLCTSPYFPNSLPQTITVGPFARPSNWEEVIRVVRALGWKEDNMRTVITWTELTPASLCLKGPAHA